MSRLVRNPLDPVYSRLRVLDFGNFKQRCFNFRGFSVSAERFSNFFVSFSQSKTFGV